MREGGGAPEEGRQEEEGRRRLSAPDLDELAARVDALEERFAGEDAVAARLAAAADRIERTLEAFQWLLIGAGLARARHADGEEAETGGGDVADPASCEHPEEARERRPHGAFLDVYCGSCGVRLRPADDPVAAAGG